MKQLGARSREASQLRQRRRQLAQQFGIPESLVGGRLNNSRRRCGKKNCRCASGPGHPQWALTLSQQGTRRVEKVPDEWLEDLEQAVLNTQKYLDAIKEVMAINMELLTLTKKERKQQRVRAEKENVRPVWKSWKKRSTFSDDYRSFFM